MDEVRCSSPVSLARCAGLTFDAISTAQRNGEVLDSVTRKVGFRRIELVRAPLPDGENGHTFVFLLNNTPLFLGGSNWIPIDSFLTNGTQARYRRLLEMARDGNQTMVRVWGGGVYEEDIFYETCVSSPSAWVSKQQNCMLMSAKWTGRVGSPRLARLHVCMRRIPRPARRLSAQCRGRSARASQTASQPPLHRHLCRQQRGLVCLSLFICFALGERELNYASGDSQIAEAEKLQYDPDDTEGATAYCAPLSPVRHKS